MVVRRSNDVLGDALVRRHDELIDTRRWLHQHPELGHHEYGTTALIRDRLTRLGLGERSAGTKTGAVFVLDGKRPGKTVLLRADIDALPVHEELDVTHRSLTDGVMHACGHDGHTAMLLTVATVLAERADDLDGSYAFVFQPGEECGDGARRMIEGGLLADLEADAALGCHLSVGALPTGTIALRSGLALADTHLIDLEVRGLPGHGAQPRRGGDAILATGTLITRMSRIVADLSYDRVACVCTCGALHAGSAANMIPELATMKVTLRTFTETQHQVAVDRLAVLVDEIIDRFQVAITVTTAGRLPAVTNDAEATSTVRRAAETVLGADRVLPSPPVTPGDDMGEFLARLPGCYFHIGATPTTGAAPHHSALFDIDERALDIGARVLLEAGPALARAARPKRHT